MASSKRIVVHNRCLSFEIDGPNGIDRYDFQTCQTLGHVEVGFDIRPEEIGKVDEPDWVKRFLRTFCSAKNVGWIVEDCLDWISKLGMNLSGLYVLLVPESSVASRVQQQIARLPFALQPVEKRSPADGREEKQES
jgi:hypothetical protein